MSIVVLCVLAPLVMVGTCFRKGATCLNAEAKVGAPSLHTLIANRKSQATISNHAQFRRNVGGHGRILPDTVEIYLSRLRTSLFEQGFASTHFALKLESITIFDFDDTLYPTSMERTIGELAWNAHGRQSRREGKPNDWNWETWYTSEKKEALMAGGKDYRFDLQGEVVKLLTEAMARGLTAIVTNANVRWVEKACKHYYPEVNDLLPKLLVLSARAVVPKTLVDRSKWKPYVYPLLQAEFKKQMKPIYKDIYQNQVWSKFVGFKTVLAIGDKEHDMVAAMGMQTRHTQVTSVKFKEDPNFEELLGEIARLNEILKDGGSFESAGLWKATFEFHGWAFAVDFKKPQMFE